MQAHDTQTHDPDKDLPPVSRLRNGTRPQRGVETLPDVPTQATEDDHTIGYDLYMAGAPLSACENDEQEHGWMDANRGQGYAETIAYLMDEEEYSIEDDYDWIRKGC